MAFGPGDFSAFDLQNAQTTLARMWAQNHVNDHLKSPLNTFTDIFGSQSVSLHPDFLNPSACNAVEVSFLSPSCEEDVVDCDTECEIDGTEVCAEMITYMPDGCFQSPGRKVIDSKCKNRVSFIEKVAKGLMEQLWIMDKNLLKMAYAQLGSFADNLSVGDGKNVADKYGIGDVVEGAWQIEKSGWDPSIIACLLMLSQDCFWNRPKFLTGSIWRKDMILKDAQAGGGCCNIDSLLLNAPFDIMHDIHCFDGEFPGAQTGFFFDCDDIGYYNVYCNESLNPQEGPSTERLYKYHINSPRHSWNVNGTLMPVKYDVYGQWKCINKKEYAWCWHLVHQGGFLKGPDRACGECPTIIQMEQPCINC